MSKRQIKLEDVYAIDITEGSYGVVQVVFKPGKHSYFFAVYERKFAADETVDLDAVPTLPILFLARSLDALIYHGDWPWLGNAPVPPGLPLPASIAMVGLPDQYDVYDVTGTKRRPATPAEIELLDLQRTVAPIRLELVLKAHYGVGEWDPNWDGLRPRPEQASSRFFPN